VTGRRILLLVVAGLLTASALLAIGILLMGRFGSTEGRILGTTALLAGYGIVALPAVMLLDQGRYRPLSLASATLAAFGAVFALALVWTPSAGESFGKTVGSVTVFAVMCAQASALAFRRQDRDPPVVRRLFALSCGTGGLIAVTGTAMFWANPNGGFYPRLFGALVVLDLLLVALQPILARARPSGPVHRLRVVVAAGEAVTVTIEGGDLATAAAKAIRSVERKGGRVTGIEMTKTYLGGT
jgi:hypothetical protein